MEYSGAGGKLIHKKNQKQKISWHCPFKGDKLMRYIILCSIYNFFLYEADGCSK